MDASIVYSIEVDGRQVGIESTTVKWAKTNELVVPTYIYTMSKGLGSKTILESWYNLEWKLGDGAPDLAPDVLSNDWRSVYCDLFQKPCYKIDAQQ